MTRFCIVTVLLLAWTIPVPAGELKIGDPFPSLTFEDQNARPRILDGSLRFLVFAPDRASSQIVTQAFTGQNAGTLQARGIAYVADIKEMPSAIASLFALPKMRKQPYPILLGRKSADTAVFPRQAGHVGVIGLDRGRVATMVFLSAASGIRQALVLDAAPKKSRIAQ